MSVKTCEDGCDMCGRKTETLTRCECCGAYVCRACREPGTKLCIDCEPTIDREDEE